LSAKFSWNAAHPRERSTSGRKRTHLCCDSSRAITHDFGTSYLVASFTVPLIAPVLWGCHPFRGAMDVGPCLSTSWRTAPKRLDGSPDTDFVRYRDLQLGNLRLARSTPSASTPSASTPSASTPSASARQTAQKTTSILRRDESLFSRTLA